MRCFFREGTADERLSVFCNRRRNRAELLFRARSRSRISGANTKPGDYAPFIVKKSRLSLKNMKDLQTNVCLARLSSINGLFLIDFIHQQNKVGLPVKRSK